jgi:hypothetical protein
VNVQGVSLCSVSSVDVRGVFFSTASSVDVQGISISTVSSVDVRGVFFSTASRVDVQGVNPFPQLEVWTCRVCIHFHHKHCERAGCIPYHRKQCGRAGCIPFHSKQCERAGCIPFHGKQCGRAGCVSIFTTSIVDVQGVSLTTVSSVATGFFECLFSSTEENKKPICKTIYILHVIIAFHWFYSIARITRSSYFCN